MGALCDRPGDLVEMGLHGVRIGEGHGERERRRPVPGRSPRTDRRSRSADRRADAAWFRAWPIAGPGRSSGRCGPRPGTQSSIGLRFGRWARWAFSVAAKFLNASITRASCAGVVRARADMGEADLLQNLADRALVIIDAEARADDLLQIDAPPAHHPIDGPVGAVSTMVAKAAS